MAEQKREQLLAVVPCLLTRLSERHKDDSITFDVSGWTAYDYRVIPETSPHNLWEYVERDAVDWSVTGSDGRLVPFPGRGAQEADWQDAYKRIPYEVTHWLALSPYYALGVAAEPDKKRAGGREEGSD